MTDKNSLAESEVMKSLRCHFCNGPNGIVCGPKLNVCQKCRDKDCG